MVAFVNRCLALVLAVLASGAPALAQEDSPVPARRAAIIDDMDYPGADLRQLFDTTFPACLQACRDDDACAGFTYNTRNGSCFPKAGLGAPQPYQGAVSGRMIPTDPAVLSRAEALRERMDFLPASDFDAARALAEELPTLYTANEWSAGDHAAAAEDALRRNAYAAAARSYGAALTVGDAADHWLAYAEATRRITGSDRADERRMRARARAAALNAALRAGDATLRAEALVAFAVLLEPAGRGRDMIPVLRLAQEIAPGRRGAALLERAVREYGFRVVDHRVESDSARPRVCAVFSEPLVQAGLDYAPYVRVSTGGIAVEAEERALCVDGLAHGTRYQITLREGLPAASGEVLARSVPLDVYVRDRAASVRFPGRAYVLPAAGDLALPVETVNTDALELELMRVSDRNLVRAIRDDQLARPLSRWEEMQFSEEMATEVWEGEAEVGMDLNAEVTTRLPLAEVMGDLPTGVYVLHAAVPGTDPFDVPAATQWFVVSDLGLSTMQGADGLHVVVRSLETADARADVEVALVSRVNEVLATATTDSRGYAHFPPGLTRGTGSDAPALVTAEAGAGETVEDIAFLSLTDPEFDLSDRGVEGRAPAPPVDVFLTTERGAYRAGETVHVTALARDGDARAIEGLPLTARFLRPDGVEYARMQAGATAAGGHVFEQELGGGVPRGAWRVQIHADPDEPPLAEQSFLVEDFLPERIDFEMALPDAPIRPGDRPRLSIDARYLFGAPAADLPIAGRVTLRPAEEGLADWPGFGFGRHDADVTPARTVFPSGVTTDADGAARIPLTLPEIETRDRPLEIEVVAEISEGSGRPVERDLTRTLAPDAPMMGLRPAFEGGVVPEGGEAGFDVIATGPDGAAVPARAEWTLNRVRTRYQWYSVRGDWFWEPVTTRTRVAGGEIALDGTGPARIAAPVEWGRYELVVARTDGDSHAAASTTFDAGWYAPAGVLDSPDMLELSLDSESYRPGDTARLRVVPRAAGTALVSVLSNRLIDMQVVEVPEGESVIELPVTEEWGTGAYVTASVLRPMDPDAGRNPARALGLAHAAIDPGPRRLEAEFEAPAEADPRGPLDVALRVDGMAEGETAWATIAAVDEGILNLTGFEPPDPEGHYFGQRRLGMGLRDVYGRLIDGMSGAMGVVRSGGDAMATMRREAPPPTEELVAYFSGPVEVGPDGLARASFDLPAFNGTVRLMGVAWSRGGVGQASADVLVRDPVVVNASLPRFLAPGDDSRLLLELTHTSGPAGRMAIDVDAPPALRLGDVPGQVELSAEGRARLSIPLTAQKPGTHRIAVTVTTPDGRRLDRRLTLPVEAHDPEIARTSTLTLDPGETLRFGADIFEGLRPGTGSATLAAGPLARLDIAGLMRRLDAYPYGCAEQVTSTATALLVMPELAADMGIAGPDEARTRIEAAIDRVLTYQAPNGAFGLWRAGTGDLWLDAYVTDFLARARERGFEVPDTAFRAAMDNLRNRLNYAPDFEEDGGPWAYALMVLAREGAAAVGDLRYYADVKASAFDTPLAAAQLGTALAAYGDTGRADAMFSQAARLAREGGDEHGGGWREDYGTPLRDTAGLLALAAESGSGAVDRSALAQSLAEGLTSRRAARGMSPQEAAWSLRAAGALTDAAADSGLAVNGAPVSGPVVRMIEDTVRGGRPVTVANTGTGPAEVMLTAFGVPVTAPPAEGRGYRIERSHYTLEGEPITLESVPVGTRVVTVLRVTPLGTGGGRLMVDDPLPAGFEIDNPNLLRAGDIAALDWLDLDDVAEHTEARDARFLAAVDWREDESFRLGYIARAVTPGSYRHPAASVEDMYRPMRRAITDTGRATVVE
ncbi:PAN domain-containing protein [Rhodobacteraceae bacterium WD3A24]|nr:PAN domain-containing protein [Rhodobacteraceae bacterium WD3A24]